MYSFFIILTLFAFFASTILILQDWFEIKKETGKSTKGYKNFLIVLIILLILSIISQSVLVKLYITEPEISYIEVDKVYKSNTSTGYYVQNKYGYVEIYEFDDICKGDGDYIICYTQPKLTRKVSDLIGRKQREYVLVVKDLNHILEFKSNIE